MLIDVVVGILVLYTCWRAFRQGFARQTIQLAGLGLGVCLAEPLAVKLSPWAGQNMKQVPLQLHGSVLALASMFVIWLTVSTIGSWMLASYRRRIYGDNIPSLGDHLFGVGVGMVKSAFVVSLLLFGFDQLPETFRKIGPVDEQVKQAKSVAVARDFNLVERLVGVDEVKAIGRRMQELAEYFKKPDESKNPVGQPVNDAIQQAVNQLSSVGEPGTK